MPRGKTSGGKPPKRPIERYEHTDKKRINNPPVGLVTPDTDPVAPTHKTYDYVVPVPSVKPRQELDYHPHLDPQLVWAGKKEHRSFEVPTVITLNMTKVVQHIWEAIRFENALTLEPVFDTERPIRSTGDMLPWYSGKACEHTKRSHINMCVYDSRWEANESLELDRNKNVRAWVKNDHIGFEITYSFKGIIHKFRPDYLIRLTNGKTLILEVKGQDDQQQQTKREFLSEWVRAVNGHGGFGEWTADVSRHPKDVIEILTKHNV